MAGESCFLFCDLICCVTQTQAMVTEHGLLRKAAESKDASRFITSAPWDFSVCPVTVTGLPRQKRVSALQLARQSWCRPGQWGLGTHLLHMSLATLFAQGSSAECLFMEK